jgi:uncharacterized protein (TIGR02594 family)
MSQEDTMRLVAELLDKTSGPLKDIQKSLRATADVAKSMHEGSTKEVRAHAKGYHDLRESIGKAKEMVAGVLSPALAALGITGFAAGEAITKLVGNLKDAAENYHKLNDAARRLGGTVDDVNEITNAYGSMGIASDKALASTAALGFHMDRMRRGNAEEMNSWRELGGAYQALWPKLAKTKTNMEALQVVRDFQSKNHVPVDQMTKLWGFLGQPEELGTKTGEEWADAFNKAIKLKMEHPENPALAKGLAGAFDDLDFAIKGLKADMVDAFGAPGISMVQSFIGVIHALGDEMKIVMGKKDTLEKLDNGVWEKANPFLKWLANPTLPRSLPQAAPDAGADRPLSAEQKYRKWTFDNHVTDAEKFAGGYTPMAFHPDGGGSSSQAEAILSQGVKTGVLAAFREWFAATQGARDGVQNTSYPTGGGSSTGGGGGSQGKWGGGGYTALGDAIRGGSVDGDGVGGGTRGDRNNNPGNMKFGSLAQAFGATHADDKGFAVFPDRASGDAAHDALLKSDKYKGLTLDQFGNKYSEGSASWKKTVGGALGIGPNDIVNNQDPRLAGAIRKAEGTGGGGGAAAGGTINSGVPSSILAAARKVALQGGPGAVSQFMASQGYPKAGAWCGEFAASVVTSAGGTPPKNPAVASNWRNWGSPTDNPQPGDIAVRRGARTGNTGSHVTIVEDYDAKTGAFTGIGGNQGAFERRFRPGQYDFRHGNDLLDAGRKAGVFAGGTQKVEGDASLGITLNGFPKGTKTDLTYGGLFTSYELTRGRQMEASEQK